MSLRVMPNVNAAVKDKAKAWTFEAMAINLALRPRPSLKDCITGSHCY